MNAAGCASLRDGRRLLVVDIENVAQGGLRTTVAAVAARQLVHGALAVAPGEQVIVGVGSIGGLFHVGTVWPQARVVFGSGPDGADRALLDVLCNESVGERFDQVSIVSGDGIFAEVAAALGSRGVTVTAAGWRGGMSARLRLASARVEFLDDHDPRGLGVAA